MAAVVTGRFTQASYKNASPFILSGAAMRPRCNGKGDGTLVLKVANLAQRFLLQEHETGTCKPSADKPTTSNTNGISVSGRPTKSSAAENVIRAGV